MHPYLSQHDRHATELVAQSSHLFGALVILLSCLACDVVDGTEYYFSASGNDQIGDGSQSSPWRTIAKFNILDLNPGDKAFFRAGDTFVGSLILDQSDSGTDTTGALISPIVIGSYGGGPQERALIRSIPADAAFKSTNGGGLELRNLEFVNGGSHASNLSSGIEFQIDQNSTSGPVHYEHVRIDNVISRGFHRSGLAVFAAGDVGYQDFEVANSQFYNNEFAGIDISAANWTELVHHDPGLACVRAYERR